MKPEAVTLCPVCEQAGARPDPYFYVWRGRHFWIYRCVWCTHQFVHPAVTPEEHDLIYSDRYFSEEGDWVCGIFDGSYVESEPELWVEAREQGFDVRGIELSPSMARNARQRYRLEVITSRIEDVSSDEWPALFDVVTLLDVLEHLPAPLATMRKVARWVSPDGFVLIRGSLSNSRITRWKEGIRRRLRLTKRLPGHPLDANMFNKRSLRHLLRASGFEISAWIGESAVFSNVLARRTFAP